MVNLMSYSFMALFLPMNFPCVYVLEKWGLRWGVIGGIISTAVGLWLRCFINTSFYIALVGQIIMALGQPLLYNAPAKVTTNWFPQKERPMATIVGTQMNILGIFVGFLLPGFIVDSYSKDVVLTDDLKDKYRGQLFDMLLSASIFATVTAILVIATFREKPSASLWTSGSGGNQRDSSLINVSEDANQPPQS